VTLFLRTGLVILIDFFIAANALFEFTVSFTAFGDSSFLSSEIVVVDALLVQGHVSAVVGPAFLAKDVGVKLLLLLPVGIDIGATDVKWFLVSTLGLPVGICSESDSCFIFIVFDWCLLLIATSEHAGLKLLILLVLSVETRIIVHTLLWRGGIRSLLSGVLPITASAHEGAITFLISGPVLLRRCSVDFSCLKIRSIQSGLLTNLCLLGYCPEDFVLGALIKILGCVTE